MSWSSPLRRPHPTPEGETDRNAEKTPQRSSRSCQNAKRKPSIGQIAMEQLIDAVEERNFIMHARMLRALNHGKPDPAITPRAKAYRIM